MKLQVGKVLIETDYIERGERLSQHTFKLFFVSGGILDVVCGIETKSECEGEETWKNVALKRKALIPRFKQERKTDVCNN